ncbi:MAG: alcohol dehydrogenase catalytic domain-containing protein [Lautropia sp.]
MKAAIFHGERRITVGEVRWPDSAPGEVRLRVRRTALCGSDGKLWVKGGRFTAGHEIFGVVDEPGHAMHGRRCAVYIPVHCGHCAACARGDTNMCQEISVLVGWDRDGGYAEGLRVPEQCLLPVPDDIEDDLAPLLLDTIGTAAHSLRFVRRLVPPEATGAVLVTGAGPVGIGALVALQDMGYRDIHACDPVARRLQLAHDFGASVHESLEGTGPFDLILECSGAHAARSRAMELVAPRGVVLLIGENDSPWPVQENRFTRRKDYHLVRTFYFPKSDHELNIELLRRQKAKYARIADRRFPIEALPEMFERFARGELMKPMLAFGDA